VLGQNKLDFRATESFNYPVATVPTGNPAGGIGPDHMNFGVALSGIGVFHKLVLDRFSP